MITIPDNIKTTEWANSITWYDEDGILYSVNKKGAGNTMEEAVASIEAIKKELNGRKVCMLADVTYSSESTRELRDYAAVELPKIIKAIAMVSDSQLGKMLANLFLTLQYQPYPKKIFNSEKEAKDWLHNFL